MSLNPHFQRGQQNRLKMGFGCVFLNKVELGHSNLPVCRVYCCRLCMNKHATHSEIHWPVD